MSHRQYPQLLRNYLVFCECRGRLLTSGRIDLGPVSFVYPTTLLPIAILMKKTNKPLYLDDKDVAGYIRTMLKQADMPPSGKSYVPLVRLPEDQRNCEGVLARVYSLKDSTKLFSLNKMAYMYLLSELVDNIYQHSEFGFAYVMAQMYKTKGFIELDFLDDGITIPGSFNKHTNENFGEDKHCEAIMKAMNGASTKKDTLRGFGLCSTMKILKALDGQALIVSGSGAVFTDSARDIPYILHEKHKLDGTLISLRMRDADRSIDIYKYVE